VDVIVVPEIGDIIIYSTVQGGSGLTPLPDTLAYRRVTIRVYTIGCIYILVPGP